jgi:type IV fimbrial biogenesis protein FimT
MDVENPPPRQVRGLTLVELITTLAVAGVSLALLVPTWSGLVDRSQVTTTANQLLTVLRYARNEAVNRNRTISLCPSADGKRCSGDPFGWQHGYLVFEDRDGDRKRAAGEDLLRVQNPLPTGLRLHSTAGRPAVRFRPDGAAWSTNTTFSVCLGDETTHNRAVVLLGTGRARVDRRTPDNKPVSCR